MIAATLTRCRHRLATVTASLRRRWLGLYGMEIGQGTMISTTAKLDKTNPRGIRIGAYTRIAFGAAILAHDGVNERRFTTRIGDECLIGARALVLPGVTIGDNCVVAAGSVVTSDVPPRSLVAGNPAVVVESGIATRRYGYRRNDGLAPGSTPVARAVSSSDAHIDARRRDDHRG